jgi:SAM-dependent methyltransferase
MSGDLAFTGERFVPGARGEIWVEHWHRYHFAARFAAGLRVVDAACGEGYGAALLARTAASVTGADISGEAIAHARAAYAGQANLAFVEAPCTRLPLADASADLFISFETVEHIDGQEAFLAEIARVLAPEGLLLISCPNKREYSDRRAYANPFHVRELYREELAALLAQRFPHARWYGQQPAFFSVIAPESAPEVAQFMELSEADPAHAAPALEHPLYFLVAASRSAATLDRLPATLSVLADRDNWVHRDYEKVMRDLEAQAARGAALESQVADREAAVQSLQRDLAAAGEAGRAAAREQARLLEERDRDIAAKEVALAARDAEILRRRGLRWWLRLPLVRLGLLKE